MHGLTGMFSEQLVIPDGWCYYSFRHGFKGAPSDPREEVAFPCAAYFQVSGLMPALR
jgi:hypothetical protein